MKEDKRAKETVKMDRRLKYFKIVAIVLVIVIIAILLFSVISVTVVFLRARHRKDKENKQLNEYKYLQYNPHTTETNFGVMSIYDDIQPEDSISYTDKSGVYYLISNFGKTEYKCYGACFCPSDDRRNVLGTVNSFRKGIISFLIAYDLFEAYDKAHAWFDEECSYQYSADCDAPSAEIEECVEVKEKLYFGETIEPKKVKQAPEMRRYYCYGKCLFNTDLETKGAKAKINKFKCDNFKQEGVVDLDCVGRTPKQCHSFARLTFQEDFLFTYCNSRHYYTFETNRNTWKTIHICVDHNKDKKVDVINLTIKCHMVRGFDVERLKRMKDKYFKEKREGKPDEKKDDKKPIVPIDPIDDIEDDPYADEEDPFGEYEDPWPEWDGEGEDLDPPDD